tara:strand:+ start:364 stop:1020 length:657 start_codon:yes stop_codon:yes gene_type:complete
MFLPDLVPTPWESSFPEGKKHFCRMFSPKVDQYIEGYLKEEHNVLKDFFVDNPQTKNMSFCAIGSAKLLHIKLVEHYAKNYTAIDPLLSLFMPPSAYKDLAKSNMIYINQSFEKVQKKSLLEGKCIYAFLFNVIQYVKDPLKAINRLVEEGDIIFISTWNETPLSHALKKNYYKYVFSCGESVPSFKNNFSLQYDKVKNYKEHKLFSNKITKCQIIYT